LIDDDDDKEFEGVATNQSNTDTTGIIAVGEGLVQ
jgi:hypothetical protein